MPGERISRELLEEVLRYRETGWYLQGLEDHQMEKIWVLENGEG